MSPDIEKSQLVPLGKGKGNMLQVRPNQLLFLISDFRRIAWMCLDLNKAFRIIKSSN
jgi:hypothetical protein